MAKYDLTTPFGNTHVPNGTKLRIGTPLIFAGDADTGAGKEVRFTCTIENPGGVGVVHCTWDMALRDGNISDQADRQTTPPAGAGINEAKRYVVLTTRTLATAATDAIAAWEGGGAGNRNQAFKNHLFSAGHFGPGLAAT